MNLFAKWSLEKARKGKKKFFEDKILLSFNVSNSVGEAQKWETMVFI